MPHFRFEAKYPSPVAGIDEVGRGPWAGPVVAAAVILDPKKLPREIDDSKKLDHEEREKFFKEIHACAFAIGVGQASVAEIDIFNIRKASHLAMVRAFQALNMVPAFALVDGNDPPPLSCPARAIVEGDARSLSIAAASIVAKVTRDRMMVEMCGAHPVYGFSRHKGYGTPEHAFALLTHGPCSEHRESFAPVRQARATISRGVAITETQVNLLIQQDS